VNFELITCKTHSLQYAYLFPHSDRWMASKIPLTNTVIREQYICMYVCILWARVQSTVDPYAEAFYSRPIVLTQEGRNLVHDVCECVRD